MTLCEWYNDAVKQMHTKLSSIDDFYDINNNDYKKYTNILSLIKKSDNKIDFKVVNKFSNNDDILFSSHRYRINFSDVQHKIIQSYFNESIKLYNICVDIWKEYNDMQTNWMIIKDVIFDYYYRFNNGKTINEIRTLIINELKNKQKEYEIENEKYKDIIDELKKKANEKYKQEMAIYKEAIKANKKAHVKVVLIKPKKDKIKIEKVKNKPNPKRAQIKKPAPDDVLKSVIKEFCTNLKNAKDKAIEDKKYDFVNKKFTENAYNMKYKEAIKIQTITIPQRGINKNGIFTKKMGKLKCKKFEKIAEKYKFNHDCKLQYDYLLKKYYLCVVFNTNLINKENRHNIVACDPGERTFNVFYSNELIGKLGDNMRIKILNWQRKIRKYQSILDKNENKDGNKIRNKKKLKKRIHLLYLKIKGYVNEIHKKTAHFLCNNFENILLPEFKTKPMISNKKIEEESKKIKEIANKEDAKKKLRELQKRIKMSKEIKFVLSMQSHYKFKKYLKDLSKKYGTMVYDCTEDYTSQCCTNCGIISNIYETYRTKTCKACNSNIDRDINGSRNIYLKNINSLEQIKHDSLVDIHLCRGLY